MSLTAETIRQRRATKQTNHLLDQGDIMNDETKEALNWLRCRVVTNANTIKTIKVITDLQADVDRLQAIVDRWEPDRDLGYIYPATREQVDAHVAAGGKAEYRTGANWLHAPHTNNYTLRSLRLVPIPPAPDWRDVVVTKENVWGLGGQRRHDGRKITGIDADLYCAFIRVGGCWTTVAYNDTIRLALPDGNEGEG